MVFEYLSIPINVQGKLKVVLRYLMAESVHEGLPFEAGILEAFSNLIFDLKNLLGYKVQDGDILISEVLSFELASLLTDLGIVLWV